MWGKIAEYYSPLLDLFTFIIMIAGVLYVVLSWGALPAEIPVHFNSSGEADGWGHKGLLIGLIVIHFHVIILCFVLNYFLIIKSEHSIDSLQNINIPFVNKEELNEEQIFLIKRNAARMIAAMNFLVSILFASINYDMVQNALDQQSGLGPGVGITTALILYICIYYSWKSYRDAKPANQ